MTKQRCTGKEAECRAFCEPLAAGTPSSAGHHAPAPPAGDAIPQLAGAGAGVPVVEHSPHCCGWGGVAQFAVGPWVGAAGTRGEAARSAASAVHRPSTINLSGSDSPTLASSFPVQTRECLD